MNGETTDNETRHINVCICTYKRPPFLKRLLAELGDQDTNGLFTYSIVVVDNDYLQSAKLVVDDFAIMSSIPIKYCVEPHQNIALARNKAIESASGDFVAFIDDDEFPTKSWLLTLFKTRSEYNADGALGPVERHFDEMPPKWVVAGNFYERPTYPTGMIIDWRKGRTNNTLLKRQIMSAGSQPFRAEFRSGEDQDFFRRMIQEGHVFVWCNEAVVYEVVPPVRWKRSFMLRRALLQGTVSVLHPSFGTLDIVKSIVAIPVYATGLPFALVLGHHWFMILLVKLCNHIGKLSAFLGINLIGEPYVTE